MPAGQPWLFALLLWRTALRQAEALNLEWRGLQFAGTQPSVTVRKGKGGRFRVVPAHPELVDACRSVPHRRDLRTRCSPGSVASHYPQGARPAGLRRGCESGIAGGRHRNRRQGPCLPQPAPQLRPPLAAVRPERKRRVRVAGTQQPHGNPGHLPGTGVGHPGRHQRNYGTYIMRTILVGGRIWKLQ